MACKLLLIRHGETVDNVNRIMQGQTPGKLTENGINQARNLGAELSQKHIDAFVSSDLQRAVDTCVEVAAPHFPRRPPVCPRQYLPDSAAKRARLGQLHRSIHPRPEGRQVDAGHRDHRRHAPTCQRLPPAYAPALRRQDCSRRGSRNNKQSHTVRLLRQANAGHRADEERRSKSLGGVKKTMMPFLTSSFFMFSSLSLYNLYCLLRTIRHFHCLKIDTT